MLCTSQLNPREGGGGGQDWAGIVHRPSALFCIVPAPRSTFFVTNPRPRGTFLKGALKAHIHISLYESNTLQEQDAALLFLSVIP